MRLFGGVLQGHIPALTDIFYLFKVVSLRSIIVAAKKIRRYVKNTSKKTTTNVPCCEFCGAKTGLSLESSRTAYPWNGGFDCPDDPNRDKLLCIKCSKLHHEFWDYMWAEYVECRI